MSSIILAGGRSSRFGQDKCSLVLGGENLLKRIVDSLGELGDEIILVLAPGQASPFMHSTSNVKITTDIYFGKGPMVGIYSGLKEISDDYAVVVACDMPFLNFGLLRYMIGLVSGFDLVIPRIGDNVEPVHAVYSRSCIKILAEMIQEDNLKVSNLIERVKVRYVVERELTSFDPELLSLFNINMPADLETAEQIANRMRSEV